MYSSVRKGARRLQQQEDVSLVDYTVNFTANTAPCTEILCWLVAHIDVPQDLKVFGSANLKVFGSAKGSSLGSITPILKPQKLGVEMAVYRQDRL